MKRFSQSSAQSNRRDFIKKTALGLGMGAVLPWSPGIAAANPFMKVPDDEKLGIALVGLGSYSTYQLQPAFAETSLCRLAGIVTGTPSKAEDWTKRHPHLKGHVYNYETFDRIADDDAIDIVYVVLPNSMHAEYTIRAAKAGKHVITEKPMATSVADAQAMIDACDAAGRKLSVGYRCQFQPHNMEAIRLGREEVFGPVKMMETEFGFRIGDPTQWRLKHALAGGGALMDVGVYAIQAARYVIGQEPIRVWAQEFKTDPVKFAEVDETITWQLTFPSGAVSNSTTSYIASTQRLYAAAERGWFEVNPAYSYSGIKGRTSEGPMDFPQTNQQAVQMDAFAKCVMEDRTSKVDGHEGLRDMKIIEAIYQSIASGKPVSLG